MEQAPFDVSHELYGGLEIVQAKIRRRSNKAATQKTYLPGNPRVQLTDPDIGEHLLSELVTEDLNKLAPHLWMVAKQDSKHISPLTDQIVRGRKIIITEKPGLHLVWLYDRVYIKPLPKCLLSHAFWEYYLLSANSPIEENMRKTLIQAACGLLRSYAYLIKHKSDFILATQEKPRLIPKNITYPSFVNSIERCKVADEFVSPRYHFGELRLTRLNFWSKIFLFKFNYHKVEWQYSAYFARYYAPILFIFGVFSVLLSAMQVVLAVQAIPESGGSWLSFTEVSRGFSVFTILFVACIIAFLLLILTAFFSRELIYALVDLYHKRHPEDQVNQP